MASEPAASEELTGCQRRAVPSGRTRAPLRSLVGASNRSCGYFDAGRNGAIEYTMPPPMLGQHTREVLGEMLGLGAVELDALADEGAI